MSGARFHAFDRAVESGRILGVLVGGLVVMSACTAGGHTADGQTGGEPPGGDIFEATLDIDASVVDLAFVEHGDLVMLTDAGVRRIRLDGTEVWRIPSLEYYRMDARPGLVVAMAHEKLVAIDDTGGIAWEKSVAGIQEISVGRDGNVVTTSALGLITSIDRTGSSRWSHVGRRPDGSGIPIADSAGIVVVPDQDPTLARYDRNGTPIADLPMPAPLTDLAFDVHDHLVGTNGASSWTSPVTYTRYDSAGTPSTFASGAGPSITHSFALAGESIFEWQVSATSSSFVVDLLDRGGATIWTLEKDSGAFGPYVRIACDDEGRCALGGRGHIEVFDVR